MGMFMLSTVRILAATIAFAATSHAYSQSLEVQTKALAQITDAADKICSIVSHAGNSQSLQVKGEVKAQLGGLIKRLADLGILGAADLTTEQYENVIHADLAETINRNADCKFKVFDKLQEKMIK
jgi:hypothetical protein